MYVKLGNACWTAAHAGSCTTKCPLAQGTEATRSACTRSPGSEPLPATLLPLPLKAFTQPATVSVIIFKGSRQYKAKSAEEILKSGRK